MFCTQKGAVTVGCELQSLIPSEKMFILIGKYQKNRKNVSVNIGKFGEMHRKKSEKSVRITELLIPTEATTIVYDIVVFFRWLRFYMDGVP